MALKRLTGNPPEILALIRDWSTPKAQPIFSAGTPALIQAVMNGVVILGITNKCLLPAIAIGGGDGYKSDTNEYCCVIVEILLYIETPLFKPQIRLIITVDYYCDWKQYNRYDDDDNF